MTMNATILEELGYGVTLLIVFGLIYQNVRLSRTLTNLRNNAFLTDERGVRVKYANASREVRAKAEQN
jgi:hypothetical protein